MHCLQVTSRKLPVPEDTATGVKCARYVTWASSCDSSTDASCTGHAHFSCDNLRMHATPTLVTARLSVRITNAWLQCRNGLPSVTHSPHDRCASLRQSFTTSASAK